MSDATNIVTKLAQTSITQYFSVMNDAKVSSQGVSHPSIGDSQNEEERGGLENLMRYEISSLISINSDGDHKRLAQNINNMELKLDIHFAARIGSKIIIPTSRDLYHLWSSCRTSNEAKYALHLYKDDKKRVLFDKPFVWPVIHLVLIMNQMMAVPGI